MTDHSSDAETVDLVYNIDEAELPSKAVVLAVSSLTDTPILDLDPLYDTIDPEYLDGILMDRVDAKQDSSVSIDYAGCHVTVTQDTVRVRTALD